MRFAHRQCQFAILAVVLASNVLLYAQSGADQEVQRLLREGQQALSAGDFQGAEELYSKLTQMLPNVAEVHANLGLVYFKERKYEAAAASLMQALKLKPDLTKSEALFAMTLSELGRFQEALPILEKEFHRTTDPETKRSTGLQLERVYTGLQRDDKAIEVALELQRAFPDDPEVLYQSGRLFGNFAYVAIEHLADVAPTSIWKHQAAAEAWESQGAFDLAIAEYRSVLSFAPYRPGIHYRLGRVLLARSRATNNKEDSEAAMHEFAAEMEIDPSNANAAYEIAEAHRGAGEIEEAERYFRMALKYYPEFEQANLGLAAVLLQEDHPESARPLILQAIKTKPQNDVAWYRLAQVDRALGDAEGQRKALAEFERLRKKSEELGSARTMFSPEEVTKQRIEDKPYTQPQ